MDGVLLSKQTAQRHDQAANLILGNRGSETIQTRQEVFERRGFRFYRVPAGGVAAPSNATTPTSATCTLMKWNAAGTVLSATTITETVYFFEAAEADQIVKVGTIAGKNVAVGLEGGGAAGTTKHAEIEWSLESPYEIAITSTYSETELLPSLKSETELGFAIASGSSVVVDEVGYYEAICPVYIREYYSDMYLSHAFRITDDFSTQRNFRSFISSEVQVWMVAGASAEIDLLNTGKLLASASWLPEYPLFIERAGYGFKSYITTLVGAFYVTQSFLNSFNSAAVRLVVKAKTGFAGHSGSLYVQNGTDGSFGTTEINLRSIITNYGERSTYDGSLNLPMSYTGQGPAIPGV